MLVNKHRCEMLSAAREPLFLYSSRLVITEMYILIFTLQAVLCTSNAQRRPGSRTGSTAFSLVGSNSGAHVRRARCSPG